MALSVGIVGLPNVGKSTLFSALSTKQAEAANYPFCTIDPNIGVVPVPDARFRALVELFQPDSEVPASVDFVDIAGLVRGASQGEGRGNEFLGHIANVSAVAHVVRCFEDENVVHVEGRVDPSADAETIHLELALRDLGVVEKRLDKARRGAKSGNPADKAMVAMGERLVDALSRGKRADTVPPQDDAEEQVVRELGLLTAKPMFYVANVHESQLGNVANDPIVAKLRARAEAEGLQVVVISAEIERQISELPPADRADFLSSVGLKESGLDQVIRTGYKLLDFITFFTAGKQEVRAWTIKRGSKAPQAAGKIHTDFERGFIRAEVIWWEDLVTLKSEAACKAAAKVGVEGKDYVVRDGDVIHFRFNV